MKMNILAVVTAASLLAADPAFAQSGSGNGQRGQAKGLRDGTDPQGGAHQQRGVSVRS